MNPEIETRDKPEIRKRSTGLKIIRIFAKVVLYTILLFLVILLSLHIPFVQRFARGKVVSYLEHKLDTKVQIGSVYVDFPKQLVLRDVYLEDRSKDTLISGGYVRADINLWRLITDQDLNFQGVGLENITAKIKRGLPDTTFNYQFIVDAFMPPDTSSVFDSTASNAIHFGAVKMDKVRLVYNDVVMGIDLTAWVDHLDSQVDLFDGIKMNFDVPTTNIKGLVATMTQLKPLASPEPYVLDSLDAAEPIYTTVKFKKANLQDVHVVYHDVVEKLTARFDVGLLEVEPDEIDLLRKRILLKDVEMNNTTMAIDFGVTERAEIVKQQAKQQAKSLLDVGWLIRINSLALDNNNIRFDDANMRRTPGMDYGHLDAKELSLKTEDLLINDDTASGNVLSGSFREKSGFTLEQLKGKFVYTAKQAAIEGLYLKTPGTELQDRIAISYYSPEALVNDIGNMGIDLELNDSKLLVGDLTTLIPQMRDVPAFANPSTTWYIDSRITGRIADLRIERLKLQGLADTRIDVSGQVTGLPNANAIQANLNIRNLASSRRDLNLFLPRGTIPNNITVPDRFNSNGQLRSANGIVNADLRINTSLGNAAVKGSFRRIADAANASYNMAVSTSNLNLGRIIQNPELSGPISATFTASGTGYDPKTAVAKIDGTIRSAVIHQYNYRNVDVHAALADEQARFTTTVHDPNIDLHLEGTANISGTSPSLVVHGMIDSMKLQELHIMPDNMIVRGKINADFPVLNPDDLQGRLLLTQALFVQGAQRLNLDTVELTASRTDSIRSLVLRSDVAAAELKGQYKLTQLGSILQQAIQPYFAVAPAGSFNNAAPTISR
jgi:translocation and assembly module TamB